MKGISWDILFNEYGKTSYDPAALEAHIAELEIDEDISNQKGIYEFVLRGSERVLNIRKFSERDKRRKYAECGGVCAKCGKAIEYEKCHADHITPWSKGGHTSYDNLQILCADCNRTKSDLYATALPKFHTKESRFSEQFLYVGLFLIQYAIL